jgi:hypothetical protein
VGPKADMDVGGKILLLPGFVAFENFLGVLVCLLLQLPNESFRFEYSKLESTVFNFCFAVPNYTQFIHFKISY